MRYQTVSLSRENPLTLPVAAAIGSSVVLLGAIAVTGIWYFRSGRAYKGRELREGDEGAAVVALRRRLVAHGYGPLPEDTNTRVFTPYVTEAVMNFQTNQRIPATGVVDEGTWALLVKTPRKLAQSYSVNDLIRAMRKNNYRVEENGKWNIVSVRSNWRTTNLYDDEIHIFRKVNGQWVHYYYPMTTDPGIPYLLNPMNQVATGAIAEGQYLDTYGFGYHRGSYEALTQQGPLRVYRDTNRDEVMDFDPNSIVTCESCGMNIHKGSTNGITVDRSSAGCQVFARSADFEDFMNHMHESGQSFFTYTLLHADEL